MAKTNNATNHKLEKYSQQIVQDISDIFYSKFSENDEKWEENDKKLNRIITTQDKILGKLENWEIEYTAGTDQMSELRTKVDSHEKRITALETAN